RKQHEWGDLDDGEYRRLSSETRGQLAGLPSESGKVMAFSRLRRVASSLGDAIAASSTHPEILEALRPQLVDRNDARDRRVARIGGHAGSRYPSSSSATSRPIPSCIDSYSSESLSSSWEPLGLSSSSPSASCAACCARRSARARPRARSQSPADGPHDRGRRR